MDYRKKCIELLGYELAVEDNGVYPQSITRGDVTTKRTEWQEGWNACGSSVLKDAIAMHKFLDTLPDELLDFIIEDKIYLSKHEGEDVKMLVLCNDLFFWACSDAEEFEVSDLDDFKKAMQESSTYGELLWVARKRGMRPQKPYYESFNENEKKLFDECGDERN